MMLGRSSSSDIATGLLRRGLLAVKDVGNEVLLNESRVVNDALGPCLNKQRCPLSPGRRQVSE